MSEIMINFVRICRIVDILRDSRPNWRLNVTLLQSITFSIQLLSHSTQGGSSKSMYSKQDMGYASHNPYPKRTDRVSHSRLGYCDQTCVLSGSDILSRTETGRRWAVVCKRLLLVCERRWRAWNFALLSFGYYWNNLIWEFSKNRMNFLRT